MDNRTIEQRLMDHVIKAGECWRWNSVHNENGYGRVRLGGRFQQAHRVAYERWVGPIPPGKQIDHVCRVRDCINPAHLRVATARENTLASPDSPAAKNAAKTHCVRGHPFDAANTMISRGKRCCRECYKVASAATRQRNLAAYRETARMRSKAWYVAHKEQAQQYQRDNRERVNAQRRERRKARKQQ